MVQLSANSDAGTGATSASYSASSRGGLTSGAIAVITERLSELQELQLPSSLYRDAGGGAPSAHAILLYLEALLQKDPASFLARYGGVLQSQELNHFEPLRSSDFEVDHWLRHYAAQQMAAAGRAADPRRLPAQIKNRRLAAMRRLEGEGDYFSEDSMRHRAPLLYHQHIGRYAPPQRPPGQAQEQAQEQGQEGQQGQEQGPGVAGGSGAQGDEDAAGACVRPGAGGVGGSCLAAALQQAFAKSGDGAAAGSGAVAGGTTGPRAAADAPLEGQQHPDTGRGSDAGPSSAAERDDGPGPSVGRASGTGPGGGGPGGGSAVAAEGMLRFSDFLLRQNDEAQLEQRRRQEQREEDAQMSEHDSDDDDDDEACGDRDGGDDGDIADDDDFMSDGEDSSGAAGAAARRRGQGARQTGGGGGPRRPRPSQSQLAALRRDFFEEMQSRFLLGHDGAFVDYRAIDADASLDADWIEQESRDAEDRYFDED